MKLRITPSWSSARPRPGAETSHTLCTVSTQSGHLYLAIDWFLYTNDIRATRQMTIWHHRSQITKTKIFKLCSTFTGKMRNRFSSLRRARKWQFQLTYVPERHQKRWLKIQNTNRKNRNKKTEKTEKRISVSVFGFRFFYFGFIGLTNR